MPMTMASAIRSFNDPKPMGRPPKEISREQWELIFDHLEVGGTVSDAAAYAKVSHKRLLRHIEEYRHVRKKINSAIIGVKHHHLGRVHRAEKSWQASAWFLERVYRKQFALNQPEDFSEERAIQIRKIVRQKGVRPPEVPSEN